MGKYKYFSKVVNTLEGEWVKHMLEIYNFSKKLRVLTQTLKNILQILKILFLILGVYQNII